MEHIHISSIAELHRGLNLPAPLHPMITVIDVKDLVITEEIVNTRVTTDLYYIGMKSADCGMTYGRNKYDFEEGTLAFVGPGQVTQVSDARDFENEEGWMLYIHPDLMRGSALGQEIEQYGFWSYDVHEALHVSEREKATLVDCVTKIREEFEQRLDNLSHRVLVSNVELLLNYCLRYYERQFHTRTTLNQDVVSKVDKLLKSYFQSEQLVDQGPPNLDFLAEAVHLSPAYLSDLLRKETGRSAKDHINEHVVSKAKNLLLDTSNSVADVAYSLGFNYPHYFSRLFKAKTGFSPKEYRSMN